MTAGAIDGLRHPLATQRKRAARDLVGKLLPRDIEPIRALFIEETSPEVYKWLGMALAKSRFPGIATVIRTKRQACVDANATDWLIAAEATALPMFAISSGDRLVNSRELPEQAEGVITLWGAQRLSGDSALRLVALAGNSDDPHLRRWSLLTLHEHGHSVPSAILLDNLSSDDYLLREWSLHVLTRFVPNDVRGRVMSLVENPTAEHPRVLEWAVHASSAYDVADVDLDQTLIDIHQLDLDPEVCEACLSQLGKRMNPPGIEYLESICGSATDGYTLASILALRTPNGPPLPPSLSRAMAHALLRIDPSDLGLRYVLPRIPVAAETRRAVDTLLADPMARVLARDRLTEPDGGGHMPDERLRVGLVVALLEEYEYIAETISLQMADHALSGRTYYTATVGRPRETSFDLIVSVVGRKGVGYAVSAAENLLADYQPHLLVSLGVSGQVHPKDGQLGDVVVGDSTTAYLENFKAVDDANGQFRFEVGSETFRSDAELATRVAQLRIQDPSRYKNWLEGERALRRPLEAPAPKVWHGPIAAGPGVVASESFKAFVRTQNRGFLAVDMESPGVGLVSWLDLRGTRLLLIRGLADGANPDKDSLDTGTTINYRQLAMRAATTYLISCLTSLTTRGRLP